ncbi:MAG: hypothetical protein K6U74_14710 [Firmicutes bacterium]|nr:hypothetical protein [Bacillota bacterium]
MVANDLQQCIQNCQQTANKLRGMANMEADPQIKAKLAEAAHHLDLCITECQFSLQQVQAGGM